MIRRDFLKLSALTATYLLTGCGGASATKNIQNSSIKAKELPIPPLLRGSDISGVKHYNLEIKESQHDFFISSKTDSFSFNDIGFLGPTLLLKDGDEVSLNFTNYLNETTTIHSHGMHVPPSMDGTAHQPISPNSTWSARYRVNQKACTNWYHPHTMEKTAKQVYKGLAGLIIVEDSNSLSLNIPKEYGVDDIPLVLQDRVFSNDQIVYNPTMREIMRGYIGEYFLANGAIEPILKVKNKNIRFRVLNGSNSTVYKLAFDDRRASKQIATDNSFLETPINTTTLKLSPGERAEIVVDFSSDLNNTVVLKELNYNKTLLKVYINQQANTNETIPNSLTTLQKLQAQEATNTIEFVLNNNGTLLAINGDSMDINVINETIPLNQIEIWNVTNSMMRQFLVV